MNKRYRFRKFPLAFLRDRLNCFGVYPEEITVLMGVGYLKDQRTPDQFLYDKAYIKILPIPPVMHREVWVEIVLLEEIKEDNANR